MQKLRRDAVKLGDGRYWGDHDMRGVPRDIAQWHRDAAAANRRTVYGKASLSVDVRIRTAGAAWSARPMRPLRILGRQPRRIVAARPQRTTTSAHGPPGRKPEGDDGPHEHDDVDRRPRCGYFVAVLGSVTVCPVCWARTVADLADRRAA
jgi:hypothetical protein